mgnify:FL=1
MTPLCRICARETRPDRKTCWRCLKGIGRVRDTCTDCARPNQPLDHRLRCQWCRRNDHKHCHDCRRPGAGLVGYDGVQVCQHCALRRELDKVIPAHPDGTLAALRPVVLAAEPLTTRRWLRRAHTLLDDLNQERTRLDHASLDQLPQRRAVEHLRALLIATNILPPDPAGPVRRLEASLGQALAHLDPAHRRTIRRWARWKLLPPLRQRVDQNRDLGTSVANARRRIEQTAAFVATLEHRGRTLTETTQHDIDQWFSGPGASRWNARPFLAWCQQHHHLPTRLELPPQYRGKATAPTDAEQRWTIADQLANDDHLDPADRVAGLLVVLYAQPLSRIVTLTRNDVLTDNDGRLQLRLGPDPLDLPEPLATLIQTLPVTRRRSTAQQLPNPWLFAGGHAGAHTNATNLGARLRRIGIEPRRMRLAAAEQLSREIPPAMLAGVLGLRTANLSRHTTESGGNWANYAATPRT